MTCEVLVMNKEAVALAADTALSITGQDDGPRMYNSAGKIFSLSQNPPIAVMTYDDAEYMSIPWSAVIGTYRDLYSNREHRTLGEYADHFIEFLASHEKLSSPEQQLSLIERNVRMCMESIEKECTKRGASSHSHPGSRGLEFQEIISAVIDELHSSRMTIPDVRRLDSRGAPISASPEEALREVTEKHKEAFLEIAADVLGTLPVAGSDSEAKLIEIAATMLTKYSSAEAGLQRVSGVVIAGFGRDELFPAFQSFDILGIVDDVFRYQNGPSQRLTFRDSESSAVQCFPTGAGMTAVLAGFDADSYYDLERFVFGLLDQLPYRLEEILNLALKVSDESVDASIQSFISRLKGAIRKSYEDKREKWAKHQNEAYRAPIERLVSHLPRPHLGAMAEKLVCLTLLCHEVTMKPRVVSGPYEVALLSREEGLIWVRRCRGVSVQERLVNYCQPMSRLG